MVGKCLDVHLVESLSECQPHAQHIRLTALHEVSPWGVFLKAVMAKLSERVKATNGRPCFEAGLKRMLPLR